mgnify:CR=1 FL=1
MTLYGAMRGRMPKEVKHLRKQVELLREGLEWALKEGGWRLWYYSSTPPPIIKVGSIGEAATINEETLGVKDV